MFYAYSGIFTTLEYVIKQYVIGNKNVLFVEFWALSLKNYCHIWNQHLRISQNTKLRLKVKIFKFGTKYALF